MYTLCFKADQDIYISGEVVDTGYPGLCLPKQELILKKGEDIEISISNYGLTLEGKCRAIDYKTFTEMLFSRKIVLST
jgi:hypothetical protein